MARYADDLARLQEEAGEVGFHKDLRAWVDDKSGVARVLRFLDAQDKEQIDG